MTSNAIKIDTAWLDTHHWGIRSSNDGVAHGGFCWAPVGEWTHAPDWNPMSVCGGGLHFETPEFHGFRMSYACPELIEYAGGCVPIGDNKVKAPRARIVALSAEIPAEAFIRCGYLVASDGATISPKEGEYWIILGSVVTVNGQVGGDCRAYGNAVINVRGSQRSGWCVANGNAVLNVQASQQGGECAVEGNAVLNVQASQQRGDCRAHGNAVLNVQASQQGGDCVAFGGAVLNVQASQQGGHCQAYDNATLNIQAKQWGGWCGVYDDAVLNQRYV